MALEYLTALSNLRRQLNREMDRVQVSTPTPEGDPLVAAFEAAMALRPATTATSVLR